MTSVFVITVLSVATSGCGGKAAGGAPSPAPQSSPAARWQLESAGHLDQIAAVTCASDRFCLVIDRYGYATSTDRGVTWRHANFAPTPLAFMGAAISCPTVNRCVAVGTTGRWPAPGVALTTDGAATWQIQTLDGTGSALNTVACPTESLCLSAGSVHDESSNGVAYVSHDGGSHWSPVSLGSQVEASAIACSSRLICMAVGNTVRNGELGPAAIVRTVDGGQHWRSTILPQPASLDYVSCVPSGRCLAAGFSTNTVVTAEPIILVQDDTTHSFMRSMASLKLRRITGLSCATPLVCVAVGAGFDDTSSPNPSRPGIVVATDDGGRSWHREAIPANVSDFLTVSCGPNMWCLAGATTDTSPYGYVVLSRRP
jgi:photosystem II stability/assembly factor-like uncharacterized protein